MSEFAKVTVEKVTKVEDHPEMPQNSLVTAGPFTVVTMKNEDGSYRFAVDELVVIVPEHTIVPAEILERTGFWDPEKNRGILAGSKGNRVKGRVVGGIPSRELIFKMEKQTTVDGETTAIFDNGTMWQRFSTGQNIGTYFGFGQYTPQ